MEGILVSKDESLKDSMVHVGYRILKEVDKTEDGRMSVVALLLALKKWEITDYRAIMFALLFLHTAGAIDFQAPYIYRITLDQPDNK